MTDERRAEINRSESAQKKSRFDQLTPDQQAAVREQQSRKRAARRERANLARIAMSETRFDDIEHKYMMGWMFDEPIDPEATLADVLAVIGEIISCTNGLPNARVFKFAIEICNETSPKKWQLACQLFMAVKQRGLMPDVMDRRELYESVIATMTVRDWAFQLSVSKHNGRLLCAHNTATDADDRQRLSTRILYECEDDGPAGASNMSFRLAIDACMEAGNWERGLILHDEHMECFDDLFYLDFDQFLKGHINFSHGYYGWEPKLNLSTRSKQYAAATRGRFAAKIQKRRDDYWKNHQPKKCECRFCSNPDFTTNRILETYSATPPEYRLARSILASHRWDCHKDTPGICAFCSFMSNPLRATVLCGIAHAHMRGEECAKDVLNDVLARVFFKLGL